MNFEEKLKELEEIVNKLDGGNISLEESILLFEKGVKLSKACQRILNSAERKVNVLLEDNSGNVSKEKFDEVKE